MRICIIGAGPTGLGAAHRLHELGHTDYCVYERLPYVGGLATSFTDAAGFTWDLGVHVSHSHYHYFDKLMLDLLPGGYLRHTRRAWVREYGRYIPYPFQYNVRHLPTDALWDCVAGLLALKPEDAARTPVSFEDWILSRFGRGIADHFMLPYNRKIWRTEPAAMGYQWIGERVPVTEVARLIKNIIYQQDDVSWGPNAQFDFPREGGTGAIWKALAARLPKSKLRLSSELQTIDPATRTLTFADGTVDRYDALISTIPLKALTRQCGLESLAARAGELRHTYVKVAGLAPRQPLPDHLKGKTWLYFPGPERFYRVTPFSQFADSLVPDPRNWCSLLCEVSFEGEPEISDADLIRDCVRDLAESGVIDIDPSTLHTFMMNAPYGYPVATIERDTILNEVMAALESRDIYSRGRFGGWKYEVANMDHSLMQGVEAVERILNGTPERTWPTPGVVNSGKW